MSDAAVATRAVFPLRIHSLLELSRMMQGKYVPMSIGVSYRAQRLEPLKLAKVTPSVSFGS